MVELVEFIVKQFAEDKDQVTVTAEDRDGAVNIVVTASESDMGRIIGKQAKSPSRSARSSSRFPLRRARSTLSRSVTGRTLPPLKAATAGMKNNS